MNCSDISGKLIEAARAEVALGADLDQHLNVCPECLERWEAEQSLSLAMQAARADAASRRSSSANREALMLRFAAKHPARIHIHPVWLAVAAMLIVGFAIGRHPLRRQAQPLPAVATQSADDSQELQEGFIAVPYVPPLATGETVTIVHTQLYPAALASLGVNVDPAWTTELPADLLVGEDGFPRAVRVSGDESNGGFKNK